MTLAAHVQSSDDLLDAYMDARLDLAYQRDGAADRVQLLEAALRTAVGLAPGTRVRFDFDLDDDPHLEHLDGVEGHVVRRLGLRAYYVVPDVERGPATVCCGRHELEVVGDG